ncbi:hypothetical protein BDW60DRAFT_74523 [Aspergillus nidulans var. acristatus]
MQSLSYSFLFCRFCNAFAMLLPGALTTSPDLYYSCIATQSFHPHLAMVHHSKKGRYALAYRIVMKLLWFESAVASARTPLLYPFLPNRPSWRARGLEHQCDESSKETSVGRLLGLFNVKMTEMTVEHAAAIRLSPRYQAPHGSFHYE